MKISKLLLGAAIIGSTVSLASCSEEVDAPVAAGQSVEVSFSAVLPDGLN